MIDVSNRVLTNIKIYVAETCKNVSNYSSKSPPSFPTVSVVQIDNQDACMDLENSENAVKSVIEIQCYSNKNITESRNIINQCCDAMRQIWKLCYLLQCYNEWSTDIWSIKFRHTGKWCRWNRWFSFCRQLLAQWFRYRFEWILRSYNKSSQ